MADTATPQSPWSLDRVEPGLYEVRRDTEVGTYVRYNSMSETWSADCAIGPTFPTPTAALDYINRLFV